jgi:hypothetical protein
MNPFAVMLLALKFPFELRETIVEGVLAEVAVVAELGIDVSEEPSPMNPFAVMLLALKFPFELRETIVEGVLAEVAVVAELGMEVRFAPDPSKRVAVTVPEAVMLTMFVYEVLRRKLATVPVKSVAGIEPTVSVPTPVIPVYDPVIRADGTVPDVRLSASRFEKSKLSELSKSWSLCSI